MLSLWALYLLSLSSLLLHHVVAFKRKDVQEAPQHPVQPPKSPHTPNVAPVHPNFGPDTADFMALPLSWHATSAEETDRQGVIGEYGDTQDSSEISLRYSGEKWLMTFSPTERATEHGSSRINVRPSLGLVPPQTTQEQAPTYGPAESRTWETDVLGLTPTKATEEHPFPPVNQNKTTKFQLPLSLSGSRPTNSPDTIATSPLPGVTPDHLTPSQPNNKWDWTLVPLATTQSKIQEETGLMENNGDVLHDSKDVLFKTGTVRTETEKDGPSGDEGQGSVTSETLSFTECNTDPTATPCKVANRSCTPTNPDHVTSSEPLHPSLALSPSLSVPLYSDWNSALATWGLAWEAHIYGLGSVFVVFGLISVVCLLGLPLRCPPGSPYLILLHLVMLGFCGIRAFSLLYDAYSHQDRVPPLGSLLLSQLPFPCMTVAFSLAFLLLSLRSRVHLSLPLSLSASFSALPRPCLLLCLCLLHFGVSLGCVGLLHLLHSLPGLLLLFPQGLFVCLSVLLSFSYVIFYCFIRADTKHMYRLNDSGEAGGSPEVMLRPASCPFAEVDDWRRAAGAGIGASLCLLGCGGLQLYEILHALGLAGVSGYGLQPWPWWAYHVGCRLCEAGVCVSLLLIGCQPIFCQANSSLRNKARPRQGSWSRLSCGSPSADLILPSPEKVKSPVLPSHSPWSQNKQEKLVVCEVIPKGQKEVLPLYSIVGAPQNGLDSATLKNNTRAKLPNASSRFNGGVESQMSSLDSLGLDSDSTVDLRPPSPIDLSRSIDQALFSESLFSRSLFDPPKLNHTSSSLSLSSPNHGTSSQGRSSAENALYRTSSCGDMDQENSLSKSQPSQPGGALLCHNRPLPSPKQWGWKGSNSGSLSQASLIGSSQGLCCSPPEKGKTRSHSWANKGQNFAPSSLPRAIPHLPYHRHYRTLSLASQDSRGSGRLAGTKHLSESRQLEQDIAVQAEFINVCKQIDALSVCSDTIEL